MCASSYMLAFQNSFNGSRISSAMAYRSLSIANGHYACRDIHISQVRLYYLFDAVVVLLCEESAITKTLTNDMLFGICHFYLCPHYTESCFVKYEANLKEYCKDTHTFQFQFGVLFRECQCYYGIINRLCRPHRRTTPIYTNNYIKQEF